MSAEDEEVVFFTSRRRTTSSRRPGVVFDRPVQVRLVKVEFCQSCGGTQPRGRGRAPHAVHASNARNVDCQGRAVVPCPRPLCRELMGGWHWEGEPCPLGEATP